MKEKLDYFFNKLLPKKFIVVTVATIIVFMQLKVPAEYWYLLMAYFGVNGLQKFTKKVEINEQKFD